MNTVYKCGNGALLERCKTAFFCSRKTPAGVEKAVDEWLETLSVDRDCVMCGNSSGMERHVFSELLRRGIPVVLVLAQAMPEMWEADLQAAMQSGRLLAITHCDASVHYADARSAKDRNLLMIGLAAEVVVGYCATGGNLAQQLANARKVRVLFRTETADAPMQKHYNGNAVETVAVCKGAAPQQWKRRMWSVNNAITIEQDSSDGSPCFRIWQVRDFDLDGNTGSKIVLSPRELIDFQEALAEVIIQVSDKRLSDVRSMAVSTYRGSLTFDFKLLTADGVLSITQRTETRFMGVKQSLVMFNAREIREFYGKVSEAAERAKRLL